MDSASEPIHWRDSRQFIRLINRSARIYQFADEIAGIEISQNARGHVAAQIRRNGILFEMLLSQALALAGYRFDRQDGGGKSVSAGGF